MNKKLSALYVSSVHTTVKELNRKGRKESTKNAKINKMYMKNLDSNAPMQNRGTPFQCFNAGMLEYLNAEKYCWDWNAPPPAETKSVSLCLNLAFPAVKKRINRNECMERAMNEKELVWRRNASEGRIRGKPHALHNRMSSTGGQAKNLSGKSGNAMVLFSYRQIPKVFGTGRNVPDPNQ